MRQVTISIDLMVASLILIDPFAAPMALLFLRVIWARAHQLVLAVDVVNRVFCSYAIDIATYSKVRTVFKLSQSQCTEWVVLTRTFQLIIRLRYTLHLRQTRRIN